jgi:hypothetical protein
MATLKDILGNDYKEALTMDEIENLLTNKKLVDLSNGEYVAKGRLTDSEKKYKDLEKKLADKMTEEEKSVRAMEEREQYYKQLEKENKAIKYKNMLTKSISDENVLNSIVDSYSNGDIMKAIELQNEYSVKQREQLEKDIKAELLKTNAQPNPQVDVKQKSWKEMTLDERMKLARDNPEEYKRIRN